MVALLLLALFGMAIVGQFSLLDLEAFRRGLWLLGTAVFLFTFFLIGQSQRTRPHWFEAGAVSAQPPLLRLAPRLRLGLTAVALVAAIIAYLNLGNNQFTPLGFAAWFSAIFYFMIVFAERPTWRLRWQKHYVVLVGILLIGIFFRFYRLNEVPVEFGSDQIEKLLDVYDVLLGQRPLFFPRNTGREALQFYWTAVLIRFTPLELNFMALKVGTGLFSVWTLLWVYLLGQELYGRQVGLLAALFMAMSHWHITITRIGLRFVFTAAFFAPTLYFLIRAFRHNRRNDWLAAGVFLGIGLHTYIPMRIVPPLLLLLTAVKLIFDYWQKRQPRKMIPFAESNSFSLSFWRNACFGGITSFIFFLPLLRYMVDFPDMFWFRASSRLANGQDLNYWQIFWDNTKRAWLMFNYRGDSVYANNLPHSPMLDEITAAFFLLGLVYLLWQLVRYRDQRSLYVLLSIGIMLLPSILSFAFTGENPSAVRTGGAIPVVMMTAVLPLHAVWTYAQSDEVSRAGQVLVTAVLTIFIAAALVVNYDWYFIQYDQNYRQTALNHSELAQAVHSFIQHGGQLENVFHIAYPYWTDTRAIGILNGQPYWNNSIHDPEQIAHHANPDVRQLFLLNLQDATAINLLTMNLPQGQLSRYYSAWSPDKDFFLYETFPK